MKTPISTRRRGAGAALVTFALAASVAVVTGNVRAQEESGAASEEAVPAATSAAGNTEDDTAGTTVEPAPAAVAANDDEGECAAEDDFPTSAVADYVLGCMAANGNTYEALQQCSCSIDFIKARMDYKSYEQAGTVMQVQRDIGQRGMFYRDSNWAKNRVGRLEALQAESTLRCF